MHCLSLMLLDCNLWLHWCTCSHMYLKCILAKNFMMAVANVVYGFPIGFNAFIDRG